MLWRMKKVLHSNRCLTSQHKWSTMKKKFIVWTKLCIRRILGHNCRWLMIQWSSVFKAQRSTYFRILCYVSAKFFNILNATKLGRTGLQEYEPRGTTEIMMLSTESQPNSSGTFSQDSQRCSSVIKSMIFWALEDKHQKISQDESYLCQSIYSMHRWTPLQRRRNKICWRIVKYMLSNCSEMFILGKNWTTWYSMVGK